MITKLTINSHKNFITQKYETPNLPQKTGDIICRQAITVLKFLGENKKSSRDMPILVKYATYGGAVLGVAAAAAAAGRFGWNLCRQEHIGVVPKVGSVMLAYGLGLPAGGAAGGMTGMIASVVASLFVATYAVTYAGLGLGLRGIGDTYAVVRSKLNQKTSLATPAP